MSLNDMPGHLIRRLHQISTHLFQQRLQEAGVDITPVQYATMDALHRNPGIEQAQVASLIAYDRATIGGVIDRLEQKEYVTRVTSARDRRAREVSLSETGLSLYLEIAPLVEKLQGEILQKLDQTEQDTLTQLLQKAIGEE